MRLSLFLLLLGVPKLAVVHQSANGRGGIRRDLYEIEALFLPHFHSLVGSDDSDLLSLRADEANLGDADLSICAVCLFGPDWHEARPTRSVHTTPCLMV